MTKSDGKEREERVEYLCSVLYELYKPRQDSDQTTVSGTLAEEFVREMRAAFHGGVELDPATLNLIVEENISDLYKYSDVRDHQHLSAILEPMKETVKMALITPQEAETADPRLFDLVYGIAVASRTEAGEIEPNLQRDQVVNFIQEKYRSYFKPPNTNIKVQPKLK